MPILLHNYFRSSASYRVRIALNLKGLPHDYRSVHLNRNGGEQRSPAFLQLNPQGLVPLLVDDDVTSGQSLAIIEYLEERYPSPSLLPKGLAERAFVRSLANHVACDVHPLNNLRVLKFLTGPMALTDDRKSEWVQHWIEQGLRALEDQVCASGLSGRFCVGDSPTMADCCLVPQIFSAQRFNVGLDAYPTLMRIHAHCEAEEAFRKAHPGVQPDSE